MRYKVYYAQNREDIILSAFFKDDEKGFYVDVGANDPTIDSVTKLFYQRGWNGINIEPIKRLYAELQRERPRDINLNIGVGEQSETGLFREYIKAEGLSTFSKDIQQEYASRSSSKDLKYAEYKVQVRPLADIFRKNDVESIQFMKVDVEGFEYEVLKGNDWDRFRPEVICIESVHIKKDWHSLLKKNGYEKVFHDGLNEYFVDKHKPVRLKNFSYLEAVLPIPTIPAEIDEEIREKDRDLINKRHELTRLELRVAELELDNEFLRQEIIQSKRLRSLIKQSVKSVDAALIAYIDVLDRPRRRSAQSFVSDAKAAQNLLDEIRVYDLKNNYQPRAGNGRRLHGAMRSMYFGATRPTAKLARRILHNLRERKK